MKTTRWTTLVNGAAMVLSLLPFIATAPLGAQAETSLTVPIKADKEGVQLEPWHDVGPFKDEEFGDVLRSFRYNFEPERDLLKVTETAPDLSKSYEAKLWPGMDASKLKRFWTPHPEWVDGYRHVLPQGPAPGRNETAYLYRAIHASEAKTLTLRVYAEDFVKVWLNGKPVGEVVRNYGASHTPTPLVAALPLAAGDNRLLLKITTMWGKHGFAFGLDGVTPSNAQLPLAWSPEIRKDAASNFYPGNRPYAAGAPDKATPAEVVKEIRDAARLLRSFRGGVEMLPMFDPPTSKMAEQQNQLAPSEEGKAWMKTREVLASEAKSALTAFDRGDADGSTKVMDAAKAQEAAWNRAIRKVGPIVFLRSPAAGVNAIAPYATKGRTPASLCVLDPAKPDQPPRVIFSEPETTLYNFNLSFDAKTVFFSACRKGIAGGWHIYEIGINGQNLKQITQGDSNDISPAELPDGRLIFISTRAKTFVVCQEHEAGLLYSCNRDGSGVRKLSANIDSDHTPQVLNDGRVMFTRWDYGIEKNVFARHGLWTINPDGTGFRLFAGNTKEDPAGFWKARPIPGRPEVVCVFGPHHSYQAGMIGLVWNRLGPEAPRGEGFRFVTEEIPSYGDTAFPYGYQDPYPLNERQFLVSYGGDGGKKNRLYLLDECGNRRCIYEAEGELGCWNPMQLQARERPMVIPAQCENPEWAYREPEELNQNPTNLSATLLVQDVYQGVEPQVKRGEVKWIQVMEQLQKSRRMAGGEAWGHTPVIGRGAVHVRRLVGLVPVEKDGSAHFTAPALRDISLNLLDADGKMLMRMGSDMQMMPGERQGCIGCHEGRQGAQAPPPRPGVSIAARKPPVNPIQPDWGTKGIVDYQKVVQPVWNRYCIECHSGPTPKGGIDLSGDRTRFFCVSYDNLIERDQVAYHQPFAGDHDENAPRTLGSMVSRLSKIIESSKQCGKEIPFEDRQRVYTWIDANAPYYGSNAYNKCRGIGARDSWEADPQPATGINGWLKAGLKPVFDTRCFSCHHREIHNQGFWGEGGGPMTKMLTVTSRLWSDRGASAHMFLERYHMSALLGPELRINLSRPANSLMIQAPLSQAAGGLGLCKETDGSPVFKDKEDSGYRTMLQAIEVGKYRLYSEPREDISPDEITEGQRTMLKKEEVEKIQAGWPKITLSVTSPTRASNACSPDWNGAVSHPFVGALYSGKVVRIDAEGRKTWEYAESKGSCYDVWQLPGGNVLFSTGHGAKEVDPAGKTVFEYRSNGEAHSCQRLPDGATLVAECTANRLVEVDPAGKIIKEIQLKGKSVGHGTLRMARKLANGGYIVCHHAEKAVREDASDGRMVRDLAVSALPTAVAGLRNGNLLVTTLDEVAEYDKSGTKTWCFNKNELPELKMNLLTGAQRLSNGDTVVTNWLGHGHEGNGVPVFQVTREKKVAWRYLDNTIVPLVVSVQILDQPANTPPVR